MVNCGNIIESPFSTLRNHNSILTVELALTDNIATQGIVYGKENTITLDTPGRTRIVCYETDKNRCYSLDVVMLTGYTIRAYVTYIDEEGSAFTAYSDPVMQ